MRVRVLFFGMLKDLTGRQTESVELADGATVGDLLGYYKGRVPLIEKYLGSVATSVNEEYARREIVLQDGDEVGLLPPVSGGSDGSIGAHGAGRRVELVRERIDVQRMIELIKSGDDGAIVVFDGIVRNNSRGRRTLYLDYDAYESMALKELDRIAGEALDRFTVRAIRIVHRLGRIEIGETSVLIAVASAHRAAAFEACRWIIDTLKKMVPIWKKEYFEDGAVWADGEPFPPEITGRNSAVEDGTSSIQAKE